MIGNNAKALLLAILSIVVGLSTISYISTPSFAESNMYAISCKQYSLSDHFSIQPNNAIMPISKNTTASETITWMNQTSAHTELASGHWQLTVTVKINSNAQPNTTYTISLHDVADSSLKQLGSIRFITPSVIAAGEVMSFVFDVGADLDSSMAFVAQIL